jgi:CubicO group peptidase (beta-lactamase class C family)
LLICATHAESARADEIDRIVAAEIQRQHSPGVAIAIVKKGQPVKVQAYGSANLELNVPATSATFFQTGSIGKQFTASLVMLLVRDGTLKLDEAVSTYLPGTPPSWSGITVRHLLTHTSGLPGTDPAIDLRKDYSEDELLASAYKLPLAGKPGQQFAYSNLGYQVLGVLCSKVGHRFWGDQMHERMFVPLAMGARVISERDITPNRAAGYERFDGHFENQSWVAPSLNTTADGSLYVSAQDMARWGMALDGGQLLDAKQKAAMWAPAMLDDGRPVDYGFGWDLQSRAGHRIVSHRGDWQGFTSFIAHLPDDRLTVVVLMNRANGQPQAIAGQIVGHYIVSLRRPPTKSPTALELERQPVFVRLRGGEDKPTTRLIELSPGHWQAKLALASGLQQFRIGDESGQAIDLGARIDEVMVKPGHAQALEVRGEGLFLDVKEPAEYTFGLDLPAHGNPMLTVAR